MQISPTGKNKSPKATGDKPVESTSEQAKTSSSRNADSWSGPKSERRAIPSAVRNPALTLAGRPRSPHHAQMNAGAPESAEDALLPVPRLDVSNRMAVTRTQDGDGRITHVLEYGKPLDHGLIAFLKADGTLAFTVNSREDQRGTDGGGRDMFISAMKRFKQEGLEVKAIGAHWYGELGTRDSDNLNQYASSLRKMPASDAAKSTWTGRLAAEFGFAHATVTQSLELGDEDDSTGGMAEEVDVVFTKPE
jgi:hypothetical protein